MWTQDVGVYGSWYHGVLNDILFMMEFKQEFAPKRVTKLIFILRDFTDYGNIREQSERIKTTLQNEIKQIWI